MSKGEINLRYFDSHLFYISISDRIVSRIGAHNGLIARLTQGAHSDSVVVNRCVQWQEPVGLNSNQNRRPTPYGDNRLYHSISDQTKSNMTRGPLAAPSLVQQSRLPHPPLPHLHHWGSPWSKRNLIILNLRFARPHNFGLCL